MKSAQEIASQVIDKNQHNRQYPVGKAQQEVLNALGIRKCNGSSHAEQIFNALGITVSSRREGRKSVPAVSKIAAGGGWNIGGDADGWDAPSAGIDLGAIEKWM